MYVCVYIYIADISIIINWFTMPFIVLLYIMIYHIGYTTPLRFTPLSFWVIVLHFLCETQKFDARNHGR